MSSENYEDKLKGGLINAARRIEIDSNYSARRHFNAGAFFRILHYVTGIGAAFLGAIAAYSIYFGEYVSQNVGGLTALASSILIAVFTVVGPGELASQHYAAGRDYLSLHNDALYLLDVDVKVSTNKEIEEKVRKLKDILDKLNSCNGTLWTPSRAFKKAREDIRKGHTNYDSNDETKMT
jgi:hypothetical protein